VATKIRLRRIGKKKQPHYRIVVADSRNARDSQPIEEIGTYDPTAQPGRVTVKEERIYEWLGKGAEPSDTVNSIFRRIGVMKKWSLLKAGQEVGEIEIKTELVEKPKPKGRSKKTAKAEAAAVRAAEVKAAPAEAPEAKAEPEVKAEAEPEVKAEAEPEAAAEETAEEKSE
jgi:small subunit ribosomal protein S16